MPRINLLDGENLSSFYFFQDQAEAEDVGQMLSNMGVPFEIQCACIKDHGREICEDFMSSCRAGVYISTTDLYFPMIKISRDILREA